MPKKSRIIEVDDDDEDIPEEEQVIPEVISKPKKQATQKQIDSMKKAREARGVNRNKSEKMKSMLKEKEEDIKKWEKSVISKSSDIERDETKDNTNEVPINIRDMIKSEILNYMPKPREKKMKEEQEEEEDIIVKKIKKPKQIADMKEDIRDTTTETYNNKHENSGVIEVKKEPSAKKFDPFKYFI